MTAAPERIALKGGELWWWPEFIAPDEADTVLRELIDAIAWEQHHVRLFGKRIAAPRLSCWIGDPGASYVYSRERFEPRPWPPALVPWRQRVEVAADERFNSVLANLYRHGDDAMGWHSDDEPELGETPIIASLNLGATRRFQLKHKTLGLRREVSLHAGSLLVMRGATQSHWLHGVPRERGVTTPRLNLTFRRIDASRRRAPR